MYLTLLSEQIRPGATWGRGPCSWGQQLCRSYLRLHWDLSHQPSGSQSRALTASPLAPPPYPQSLPLNKLCCTGVPTKRGRPKRSAVIPVPVVRTHERQLGALTPERLVSLTVEANDLPLAASSGNCICGRGHILWCTLVLEASIG